MAWFGQGRDTIEWKEYDEGTLFYKWDNDEIKKGAKLIIRTGQKAVFYAGGAIEGVFEKEGTYDIETEIVPFLSSLKGFFQLRGDSGMRAEVYFVNAKELLLRWGTRQRIMIPTVEVPSGIPVGCNGTLVVTFRDYLTFIKKIAGVKARYTIEDISERIMGELNPIIAESILEGNNAMGLSALVSLQMNSRRLSKKMQQEMDKELYDIGLAVTDLNILSINYPPEVAKMAEKMAAQSFVQDTTKYTTIAMADGLEKGKGSGMGTMGAEMMMGMQMAQNMANSMNNQTQAQPPVQQVVAQGNGYICTGCSTEYSSSMKFCSECGKPVVEKSSAPVGDRFCPKCRKMTSGKFCNECGTQTV